MLLKTCNVCKEERPAADFYKLKSAADGLQRHCKQCHREMNQKYLQTDKGKTTHLKNVRKYQQTDKGKLAASIAAINYTSTDAGKARRRAAQQNYLNKDDNREINNNRTFTHSKTPQGRDVRAKYRATDKWKRIQRIAQQNRHCRKLNATPLWFGDDDKRILEQMVTEAQQLESATGIPYEIDHIVPLQGTNVCGLHCKANWQLLPATENRTKGNKFPYTTGDH